MVLPSQGIPFGYTFNVKPAEHKKQLRPVVNRVGGEMHDASTKSFTAWWSHPMVGKGFVQSAVIHDPPSEYL